MKRDYTKFLCDIGELSAACHSAPCLEDFLQRAAEMTASHMQSEVCSIYLYFDEARELVLKATHGLFPDAVGRVRLKLGEGLTGLALKEMRPICETEASKRPGYRYFPDIGEEKYESFLAVPILRGQNRIGVMVVQNVKSHHFQDDDIHILRAITSQLANTIETVKVLMSLEQKLQDSEQDAAPQEPMDLKLLKGRGGAPGSACGLAAVIEGNHQYFLCDRCLEDQRQYSLEDFERAVRQTEEELESLQEDVGEKLADVASMIFTAQILMLKDKGFRDAITARIHAGENPPVAVKRVVHDYVHKFQALENAYLQEKAQDVEDIGIRLLEHLVGGFAERRDLHGRIVIARELYPSDMLKLSSLEVRGLILLSGGVTSHVAILARSLEIPLVFIDDSRLLKVARDTRILIDGDLAVIHVEPDPVALEAYERERGAREAGRAADTVKPGTVTLDGERVVLQANINLLVDLKTARTFKAEGIGLYRTEFPFIARSDFPTEEEQVLIYQRLVEGMPGREVTFRTLDIGGDKVLSYYDYEKEANPFLGMRSIRFSLRHKEIFHQQLRAILRAGAGADLRMMFPMISSLDEFLEARQEVEICIRDLHKEGQRCHESPRIGMMVELPAVVEIIDDLAAAADFFSIGTNDFIQYMLAVDRTNEKVADLYLPHHPAVLRSLNKIAQAARRRGIGLSVCGDMSYEARYLPFFLGIGIRTFSVDAHLIPRIQREIEAIDTREAGLQAAQMLGEATVAGMERRLGEPV